MLFSNLKVKKFFLIFTLFIFSIIVFTGIYLAKAHHYESISTNEKITWREYADNKNGFSIEVPSSWSPKPWRVEMDEVQKGFIVQVESLYDSTSSVEYYSKHIAPYPGWKNIRIEPLGNSNLDGFIVEDLHLDDNTPGPEALVFNYPHLIKLEFNPTGIKNGETIFQHIISSMKVWKTSAQGKDY